MTSPRRRSNLLDELGASLENLGQVNRAMARLAAVAELAVLAIVAYSLPNLVSSPLCWLGIVTGVIVGFLLWALLTKRLHPRVAVVILGIWLIVELAAGFVVPWDQTIGDGAITLGVFMGLVLSFALLQIRGSLRTARAQ